MKSAPIKPGISTAIALFITVILLPAFPFPGETGSSTRGLTESIQRSSFPGSGPGSGIPCGIFGVDFCKFAGSSRCYSYNPEEWPAGPPSNYNDMGPGTVGSNLSIHASGSGRITGQVTLAPGGSWSYSGSVKIGEKLYPPRNPTRASQSYVSGSPAAPGDSGYEYGEDYLPQWDKDDDGDTDGTDYDWVIQNGGLEGGGSPIPYTQPNDPTIRKDSGGNPGAVAVAGKFGDYSLENGDIMITGSTDLHFTGTAYRFNNFRRTGSGDLYFGTGGNDTNLYCVDFRYSGSGDIPIASGRRLVGCFRDTFKVTGSGTFNEDGCATQFDMVSPGTDFDISGSGDAVAGCFYVPNADVDISGSGKIYAAIIAKSLNKTGSGKVCYPTTYEGPPGGSGGPPQSSPPQRTDWQEIIACE